MTDNTRYRERPRRLAAAAVGLALTFMVSTPAANASPKIHAGPTQSPSKCVSDGNYDFIYCAQILGPNNSVYVVAFAGTFWNLGAARTWIVKALPPGVAPWDAPDYRTDYYTYLHEGNCEEHPTPWWINVNADLESGTWTMVAYSEAYYRYIQDDIHG